MRAYVFYIRLTDEQIKQLNGAGWSGEIGRQYLAAKDGILNEDTKKLFEHAATVEAECGEEVWVLLQNGVLHGGHGWKESKHEKILECKTDFPRSMDVGDIIVWDNGLQERVASIGFQPIQRDNPLVPIFPLSGEPGYGQMKYGTEGREFE